MTNLNEHKQSHKVIHAIGFILVGDPSENARDMVGSCIK